MRCGRWAAAMFHAWQLVTYAFLHGSCAHIFFNMFALFMFGRTLETYWGSRRFVVYYLVCVLAAGLTQLAVQNAAGAAGEHGAAPPAGCSACCWPSAGTSRGSA